MDKFLQAELEIGQTKVAGHEEKPAKEPHRRRSREAAVKSTRTQFAEAGSRQKKSRREPETEAPSQGIFTSAVDPEPIHAGPEEDENFEIPLHRRSRRTKGPAVVTVEELSEEVTKGKQLEVTPCRSQCPPRLLPRALFRVRENVDPKDIQPGSPVEMMSSAEVPGQSPTTGLVGANFPPPEFYLSECTYHIDESSVSYQSLIDDIH